MNIKREIIIFNLRFSEDYYDKEAMVNFLICTRKIGDTFKNLTQLGQSKHGVDAVCNYKQADMSAITLFHKTQRTIFPGVSHT